MNTYIVNSGTIRSFKTKALNHRVAMFIAINAQTKKAVLGTLISAKKWGEPISEEIYMNTERVLELMDLKVCKK